MVTIMGADVIPSTEILHLLWKAIDSDLLWRKWESNCVGAAKVVERYFDPIADSRIDGASWAEIADQIENAGIEIRAKRKTEAIRQAFARERKRREDYQIKAAARQLEASLKKPDAKIDRAPVPVRAQRAVDPANMTYMSPHVHMSFPLVGHPPVALYKAFLDAKVIGAARASFAFDRGLIRFRRADGWSIVLGITWAEFEQLRGYNQLVVVCDPGYPCVEQTVPLQCDAPPTFTA